MVRALREKNLTFHHTFRQCVSPSFEKKTKQLNKKNQHPSLDPSHRHCLFVLCTIKNIKNTLYSVGLGLRPVTSFDICFDEKQMTSLSVQLGQTVGGWLERESEREVNCRRRRARRVRIPKRNVCCDNYFLFWEIATSIGYLQDTKTTKTSNKTKQIAGPSPIWWGERRKGSLERRKIM